MNESIKSLIENQTDLLYGIIGLIILMLIGVWFQQFNFRFLGKILRESLDTNRKLIEGNDRLIERCKGLISEVDEFKKKNWEIKRKLEQYEDIYGPLNTES